MEVVIIMINSKDVDKEKKRIECIKKATDNFIRYLSELPIYVPSSGVIAGPRRFYKESPREIWSKKNSDKYYFGFDNYHFPINTEFLSIGYKGIIERSCKVLPEYTLEQKEFLDSIKKVYKASIEYIKKHAEEVEKRLPTVKGKERKNLEIILRNCRALCNGAPQNFMQAVQLFWFTWRIRSPFTSSIGRLDQYLYPFYKYDIEKNVLTDKEVIDILCELWEAFNDAGSGDTLKNLMLGGVDRNGEDATNELSYLMLEVSKIVRKAEPHINVRIHSKTPNKFIGKTVELQLLGQGQPTIYNDDLLIPSLVRYGVPLSSARNYSNDGCTELVIDGESGIFFYQMEAVKALELALFNGEENNRFTSNVVKKWTHNMPEMEVRSNLRLGFKSGDLSEMTSFDEVYNAFLKQYFYQIDIMLQNVCTEMIKLKEEGVSSPFLSGLFPICLEKAVDPLRGGFNIECFQLLSGSITTVADGLSGIKKVVFEDKLCTMKELLEALKNNFQGNEILRQRLLKSPKFGNDDDFVDLIAADIAKRFCEYVSNYPTPNGKAIWPGLYNIDFNTFAKILGATPDGRKAQDPIAEHFSPTPGRAQNGPTAVINSAAKAPLYMGVASSPLHITLSRNVIPMEAFGQDLLKNLLLAAMKLGIVVLNIAIYDAETLKKAKVNPEKYEDIIVRVWGFNARFVDLTEELQDHIIARIINE